MLKIGENKYVVYNCDGLIVILTFHKEKGEIMQNAYFKTYENRKNISNEYIEDNLEKSLSIKDKFVAAYKKSFFNRNLSEEIILAGEILKPVYLGQEVLKTKEDEITRMIRDCVVKGDFISGFETSNGINVKVSNGELSEIVEGFERMEQEHKKRVPIRR